MQPVTNDGYCMGIFSLNVNVPQCSMCTIMTLAIHQPAWNGIRIQLQFKLHNLMYTYNYACNTVAKLLLYPFFCVQQDIVHASSHRLLSSVFIAELLGGEPPNSQILFTKMLYEICDISYLTIIQIFHPPNNMLVSQVLDSQMLLSTGCHS